MTRSYLEIKGLKKSFGLKPILRGIDLELNQGERKALMGANGAGKTTLLRILAGLTAPGAGAVRIAGLDLTRDAQRVRQLVGFVGHQPYLYDELTALEKSIHSRVASYSAWRWLEHCCTRPGFFCSTSRTPASMNRGTTYSRLC